jgi:hypothetical protein
MKSRFMRSMLRTTLTFAGSYMGAKVMGWVFDNVIDRRR